MSVWEEIKSKLRVDEVISDYVPILPAGANYKCICPFHKEKTPSLMINPSLGIWHCFGCGAGGDIFTFVEMYEGVDKAEALEILAKKAGVDLERHNFKNYQKPTPEEEKQKEIELDEQVKGYKLLEWTGEVYFKVLQKILPDRDNPITAYCLERNFDSKIIDKFKIGYAPSGDFLLSLAKKYNLDLDLLQRIGVLRKTENGALKDKFSDRLVFPIFDVQGKVVGFTARTLPYDKNEARPKYLNSPQTDWFNKGEIWFGWHLSRSSIIKEKKALVMEGNVDVISAHSKGLDFALASQGTSFTSEQVKKLRKLTKTIWLAFDNDEAGKTASNKFFKIATTVGLEVRKVLIPEKYKDLDEWLNSEKVDLNEIQTVFYLDYVLNSKEAFLRSEKAETQKVAVLEVVDLLNALDELSLDQYISRIQKISGIGEATLRNLVKEQKSKDYVLKDLKKDLENVDFDNRPETDIYKNTLVNWQNLVAMYLQEEKSQNIPLTPQRGKTPNIKDVDPLEGVKEASETQKFPFVEEKLVSPFDGVVFEKTQLQNFFYLLKHLLVDLKEYEDFDDYVEKKREVLEFIFKEKMSEKTESDYNNFKMAVTRFLDNKVNSFMLDSNLKEKYLEIKKQK